MVELTVRALFQAIHRSLTLRWNVAQRNIRDNILPTEDEADYLRGNLLVWQNVLKRLADGCLGVDSEKAYHRWLTDYRNRLMELSGEEESRNNPFMKGQIESFNLFLQSFLHVSKSENPAFLEKLSEIHSKENELEELKDELESIMWKVEGMSEEESAQS